ncbi:hypothetical protein [Litoribacter populi]|uniref:hypothetical protein n=1 Tax=Litoribacter populi TaxID=2598460 RepID=UPI00117DC1E9|nr:hypothetical protein [Litoribacter populi]
MKLSVKHLLRGGVFALAATFAFAFTQPKNEFNELWGFQGDDAYNVTGVTMGPGPNQYQCNQASGTCLYEDREQTIPVSGAEGVFIPGSALEPEHD